MSSHLLCATVVVAGVMVVVVGTGVVVAVVVETRNIIVISMCVKLENTKKTLQFTKFLFG